jgi:flagellar hook-associated protein 2
MSPIQLSGLATGLDTSSLIQQLMALEQRGVTSLQTRRLTFQTVAAAYTDLNTKLAAVKTRADALRDPASLFSRSVSSSDDAVVTATASPGSTRGSYALSVTGLARGSIATATATKAAVTDVIAAGTGTFEFKLGATGATVSIDVDTTTTLEGLVDAINEASAGVKATTINAGTSAAPAWKLTLTSTATGAANDIVIVNDDTSLGVANTQPGEDAEFAIAGLGSFTRATNTFSDVLDGVTITLKASSGSADLTLDYDKSATRGRLQMLLDAYNDVVRAIDKQTAGTKTSDGKVTPGSFTGDAIPRQIRSGLAGAIATAVDGTYERLAEIGVTTQKDGTLALDATMFDAAMTDDPDGVTALVSGTASEDGIADLLYARAEAATLTATGTIAVKQDSLTTTMRRLDKQITEAQTRLETVERSLRARFVALEKTIAQLQGTGNSLLSQLAQLQNQSSGG